ncbi:hypothetical protein PsYK624_097880 [Phanerochaete sordida]|uniref:Uncharacterized protein n=1 Tax=Phanerochaete sordida TaxID=48140 RepID=A0A9P3LGD1_9APHY|nr:hypothetical protein PsYK624_097880 [Phanerochaete sordida]
MFSFKSLAVFSALAFGAMTAAAAPLENGNSILARCGCSSAAGILTTLTDDLSVPVGELKYITASNCTLDVLRPIMGEITTTISASIVEVQGLIGQPAEVILATVDGTAQIAISDLAQLVADLLILVFGAIGVVLNIGGGALAAVLPLLVVVGDVLGCFVALLLNVVGGVAGGLTVAVLGLIGSIVQIILRLNVSVLISVIGIPL